MYDSQASQKINSSSQSLGENNYKITTIITLGLLVHNSTLFNLYKLFSNYFLKSKPLNYQIKNENHYEFNPNDFPNENIKIHKIGNLKKLKEQFGIYKQFLIFLDIQQGNCLTILDEILNVIIDCSERNFVKKSYIFGFYEQRKLEILIVEKIKLIVDAKQITYEYNQINYKNENEFNDAMEFCIQDINEIEISRLKGANEEEIINNIDHSSSKCILM